MFQPLKGGIAPHKPFFWCISYYVHLTYSLHMNAYGVVNFHFGLTWGQRWCFGSFLAAWCCLDVSAIWFLSWNERSWRGNGGKSSAAGRKTATGRSAGVKSPARVPKPGRAKKKKKMHNDCLAESLSDSKWIGVCMNWWCPILGGFSYLVLMG